MILFWVICALMVAVALAFVLPPLVQRHEDAKESEQEQKEANVAVYRDQLSELETDLGNGIISRQQYDQDREEIERRVLEEASVGVAATKSTTDAMGKRGMVYALALALPLVATVFYRNCHERLFIATNRG